MENEVTYLNYGNNKVDQKKFLENSANAVTNYVSQQPWSEKRKKLFLEAYSDLMNRGVTGASNDSGQWQILYNGDVGLDSKSKKQKEMYGEAAYFIQQQLNNSIAKEEKQEENKLAKFSNSDFISNLEGYIGTHQFGGQNFNIASQWNTLDKADSKTGIRETQVRAKKLAESLRGYAQSLKDDSYNFENSPFTDINDFKNKLNEAANHLENGTWTPEILNKIGLDPEKYLSTGANDIINPETGQTRQQYIDALLEKEAEKQAEEIRLKQQKELAEQKQNYGILSRISGIHSKEARLIPEKYNEYLTKYGVGQKGFDSINNEIKGLLETAASSGLTNNQKRKLGNFLYHIRKNNPNYQHTNLSNQDWAELSKFKNLGSTNRNGFIRLPWQLADGRYTYADDKGNVYFLRPQNKQKLQGPTVDRNKLNNYRNNFLKGTSIMNAQNRENYLKSSKDGLTSAEWEELASIGFDIASIVDPEMFSAAGLALAGSGLRHHAASSQPGGMSTSDKWWQAADYGLSILGSIPVLGDAALAARAVNNLKKAIVPLGIVMAGANVPQVAKAAYNKVVNGQDLTIQDWRAIGGVLTAAVGMGRGRQMAKRAEALQRTGGITSKSTKQGVIKTTEGEIKISESKAKQLKEKFGKNDGETRTKALREDAEIQKAAREQGIDLSKAEVQGYGRYKSSPISTSKTSSTSFGNRIATLRAMSEFNKNHGWLARKGLAEQDWVFRHTGGYTSNPHQGIWQSVKDYFGKSKWDEFGGQRNSSEPNTPSNNQPSKSAETLKLPYAPNSPMFNVKRPIKSPKPSYKKLDLNEIEEFKNFYLNGKQGKGYGNINHFNPKSSIKEGKLELNFGGQKVTFELKSNKNMTPAKIGEFRRAVAEKIIPLMKKSFVNEQIENLQKLKAQGWLKQGGTIDKQKIHKYKEFINK